MRPFKLFREWKQIFRANVASGMEKEEAADEAMELMEDEYGRVWLTILPLLLELILVFLKRED